MRRLTTALPLLLLVTGVTVAQDDLRTYRIRITNVTSGQSFTPILAVTHDNATRIFGVGREASAELATLAEGGDTAPLESLLSGMADAVADTAVNPGLLGPGKTAVFEISSRAGFPRLTLAAMLIPTNDSFVAINRTRLPRDNEVAVFHAFAYDAGSEPNDELCANIPGPVCGGAGTSPGEGGEGFVHVSRGISGHGDLEPSGYDWRNPVARIQVKRVRPADGQ
jgi:hypothetical protein